MASLLGWSEGVSRTTVRDTPSSRLFMASQWGEEQARSGTASATRYTSATENTPVTRHVAPVADVADLPEAATTTPVESGPCWSCGKDFRRFETTDYQDMCTPCSHVAHTQHAS